MLIIDYGLGFISQFQSKITEIISHISDHQPLVRAKKRIRTVDAKVKIYEGTTTQQEEKGK